MKIRQRDKEIMGWILEQKFMTQKQVRQVKAYSSVFE